MADQTMAEHAAVMVAKLQTLLQENVGIASVTVDGQQVAYTKLTEDLAYWQSVVDRASGVRPRAMTVKLG
ncbi:MAG: hypothetical protein JXL80_18170 [Planctomycetes bacterium]|nr:hypothetical protein [Planctomycetota bacterium]